MLPPGSTANSSNCAPAGYFETASNILLIGPSGTGKTHLSVGLARAAAHASCRTDTTTAADLAARCDPAAIEGRWGHHHALLRWPHPFGDR